MPFVLCVDLKPAGWLQQDQPLRPALTNHATEWHWAGCAAASAKPKQPMHVDQSNGGTAQRASSFQPAPASLRIRAFTHDFAVICIYLVALFALGFGALRLGILPPIEAPSPWAMDLLAFATTVLPVTLYFAWQEGGSSQATWGKRKAGIRVIALDGQPVGYGRALARSAVKFAPWQLAHTCLFHIPGWPVVTAAPSALVVLGLAVAQGLVVVYLAALFFTRSHRTPYDRVAGTVVTAQHAR